jgi:hypothetical protein
LEEYATCDSPFARSAWDDGNEKTPPSAESRRRRIEVFREYAGRYKDKVAGWWFDAVMPDSYRERPHDWRAIEAAVHAANPKGVIAFSWGSNRQACLCPEDCVSVNMLTRFFGILHGQYANRFR